MEHPHAIVVPSKPATAQEDIPLRKDEILVVLSKNATQESKDYIVDVRKEARGGAVRNALRRDFSRGILATSIDDPAKTLLGFEWHRVGLLLDRINLFKRIYECHSVEYILDEEFFDRGKVVDVLYMKSPSV
jgi:hypothetical protein